MSTYESSCTTGANRIAALRHARGLTRRAAAKAVGVTEETLWRWETGGNLPTVRNASRLAAVLNTTLDGLFSVPDTFQSDPE